MSDILLQKMFEVDRWEKALETGIVKGINKADLRALTTPEMRANLYLAIKEGRYAIAPPHMAQIPKDTPGEYRTVYVNENIDRIFLSIVNDLLFEEFGSWVHPSCKSYQKGIGCGKVVQEAVRVIGTVENNTIGFKADLSKYFDRVSIECIDVVFNRIDEECGPSKVVDVLRKYYHQDWCFDLEGNLIQQYQSLKQGCAVASFLADVLLYNIDAYLCTMAKEDGGFYCRYSDDILYIGHRYGYALDDLTKMLKQYGLSLNPKKVEILTKDKWFKFLGFSIKGSEISLSSSRIKSFQREIEARTIRKVNRPHDKDIAPQTAVKNVMNWLYYGDRDGHSWATNVLPIITVQKDISELDKFVKDCLRAVETKRTKLGGLGYDVTGKNCVLRGKGKNVRTNRDKTEKTIKGYVTLTTAKNAIMSSHEAYRCLIHNAAL